MRKCRMACGHRIDLLGVCMAALNHSNTKKQGAGMLRAVVVGPRGCCKVRKRHGMVLVLLLTSPLSSLVHFLPVCPNGLQHERPRPF